MLFIYTKTSHNETLDNQFPWLTILGHLQITRVSNVYLINDVLLQITSFLLLPITMII